MKIMKRYVEVEPICPFVGKPCIKDGWEWNSKVYHPCVFWDENTYNGVYPEQPCKIKRAIARLLIRETPDEYDPNAVVNVPWNEEKE